MRYIIYSLIATTLACLSCKNGDIQSSVIPQQTGNNDSPRILFINLEISEDSATKATYAVLLNSIITEGRLKNITEVTKGDKPGDLHFSFLSNDGKVLHKIELPNPLKKTYEVASEKGEFQKNVVSLKKATVSLRVPFSPVTSQLLVQQVRENEQIKNITTINLGI